MRIFYAAPSSPNAAFASQLWRNNLYAPLVELGHDVVEFQYDLRKTFQNLNLNDPKQAAFVRVNRGRLSAELLRQVRAAHAIKPIDLLFTYFYDACVLPACIEEIRSLGILTVNWYCNGSYQLHLVSEIAPHYDWCLVPERNRLADYRALGARPLYCQEAANPNIYRSFDLLREFDVTFVGYAYGDRLAYVRHLVEQGIAIRVWGHRWQEEAGGLGWDRNPAIPRDLCGHVLSDDELVRMYSRSTINLGFSGCADTDRQGQRVVQVRLRDFEIPMSGGFYMVEYMEELEEFFDIGKEIVCYTDAQDLADKIKYYLGNDRQRDVIRRAGCERCRRDHTWQKRFETVFQEMGLSECVA